MLLLEEISMTTGTVKFFNTQRGYGFIEPDDGSKDAFVHISAVERAGLTSLNEGQKVSYDVQPGQNGKSSAENLSVIEYPRKAPPPTLVGDGRCSPPAMRPLTIVRWTEGGGLINPPSFLRQH